MVDFRRVFTALAVLALFVGLASATASPPAIAADAMVNVAASPPSLNGTTPAIALTATTSPSDQGMTLAAKNATNGTLNSTVISGIQYALGFAFISDVGARNLATGYLVVATNTTTVASITVPGMTVVDTQAFYNAAITAAAADAMAYTQAALTAAQQVPTLVPNPPVA